LRVEFEFFVADVSWIGEVDSPLRIERQVVRTVESLVVVLLRQALYFAVLVRDADSSIAAGVRTFARNKPANLVELQPVRPAGGIAENSRLLGRRVELHDPIPNVAEVDARVRPETRAFRELAVAPEFLQLGFGREELCVVAEAGDREGK